MTSIDVLDIIMTALKKSLDHIRLGLIGLSVVRRLERPILLQCESSCNDQLTAWFWCTSIDAFSSDAGAIDVINYNYNLLALLHSAARGFYPMLLLSLNDCELKLDYSNYINVSSFQKLLSSMTSMGIILPGLLVTCGC